jgi:hypothetical protein
VVWINSLSIVYYAEEQRENVVYAKPKQTNIVPVLHECCDLSLQLWYKHDDFILLF